MRIYYSVLLLLSSTFLQSQICPDSFIQTDGLVIEDLGKIYTPHPATVPHHLAASHSDRGGTTSVRRVDAENLKWKTQGYYQRNRELGQCFNIPKDTSYTLRSIVLRTGNSSNAVLPGAPGSKMYLQLFEVIGTPKINDNNTPSGTPSTHGFNTNHRTDDYLDGIRYETIAIIEGGIFPDFEPTSVDGGQPGHLRYMRWKIQDAQLVLEGGRRYAFMVGFTENGPSKGFSLGNDNQAASGAAPIFRLDPNGVPWWSMRREGDGTLPPTQVPGQESPADDSLVLALKGESLYAINHRCSLSPTTDGFPDVDTYRALEFYVEVENGCPEEGALCDDGDPLTIDDRTDGNCGCMGKIPNGCEGSGTINYARYDGLFVGSIGELEAATVFPDDPTYTEQLSSLEAPTDVGNNFGARMFGYLCPPLSGYYTFYISGDHHVALNLSSNASVQNLTQIAFHAERTLPREWEKYATQVSQRLFLRAGSFYFVEALMKEDGGEDHLSVAWELPNGVFQGPIPGQYLSAEIACEVAGTPCDDGNPLTANDVEDGTCNCSGENICLPEGTPCDDANPLTQDDREDGQCGCEGIWQSSPGLKVTAIGQHYLRDESRTPDYLSFDRADLGGSTSVRNVDADHLSWKQQGYFQRNRDLGQTFSLPSDTSFLLDAIVLRTGNSSSAVKLGALGAEVYMQLFEVKGEPLINDAGTPTGSTSSHGFTSNHRADDYLEGISYETIVVASGGFFPFIGPTSEDGGQLGHLEYLRWDLVGDNEILLEGGKRYAFMVGFRHAGPQRGFTLANVNNTANPASPKLEVDALGTSRWSMRREGDGTIPPAQVPGSDPPFPGPIFDSLVVESLFKSAHPYVLDPTTDGFPDVDTYRTHEYYVETKPPLSTSNSVAQTQKKVSVFPNPGRGYFFISFNLYDSTSQASLRITDIAGQEVATSIIACAPGKNRHRITFEHKGVYHVTLSTLNWRVTKRIIMQ